MGSEARRKLGTFSARKKAAEIRAKMQTGMADASLNVGAFEKFDRLREKVERVLLVKDEDMRAAARWLWREAGVAVELSGAAAVAAMLAGHYHPAPGERVCAVICGAGTDGIN